MLNIFVFDKRAYTTRKPMVLEKMLIKGNYLKKQRVGRTTLMLVKAEDAVQCTYSMLDRKLYFYSGVDRNV